MTAGPVGPLTPQERPTHVQNRVFQRRVEKVEDVARPVPWKVRQVLWPSWSPWAFGILFVVSLAMALNFLAQQSVTTFGLFLIFTLWLPIGIHFKPRGPQVHLIAWRNAVLLAGVISMFLGIVGLVIYNVQPGTGWGQPELGYGSLSGGAVLLPAGMWLKSRHSVHG